MSYSLLWTLKINPKCEWNEDKEKVQDQFVNPHPQNKWYKGPKKP